MGFKIKRREFTLIEILVVIAVIAILSALLLAVYARVQERGRAAICQSNLKQIALATQQYTQDNDGHYTTWMNLDVTLSPYISNSQVYFCPTSYYDNSGAEHNLRGSYVYNLDRFNTLMAKVPERTYTGRHEAVLLNVTTIWMLTDGTDQTTQHSRPVSSSCGRTFLSGTTWHSGGANYAFLDGHIKWLTPEAMGEIECANPPITNP